MTMNTTNKEIKEKEERLLSFKKEVEGLHDITDAEEYARQLAHLFLGNGLSLQTILLMAIDFGRQHPQWIPVEERLPEEDGRYWCCDDDGGQEELKWSDGHWYGLLDPYPIEGITHWMLMPPVPRKEE